MQFTPQQLSGGASYQDATRIGNWVEDVCLREYQQSHFVSVPCSWSRHRTNAPSSSPAYVLLFVDKTGGKEEKRVARASKAPGEAPGRQRARAAEPEL